MYLFWLPLIFLHLDSYGYSLLNGYLTRRGYKRERSTINIDRSLFILQVQEVRPVWFTLNRPHPSFIKNFRFFRFRGFLAHATGLHASTPHTGSGKLPAHRHRQDRKLGCVLHADPCAYRTILHMRVAA